MTKTLRAAVYGRESKDKTKSVDDQVAGGQSTVADLGWTLTGIWRDGTSASRYARKARDEWPKVRAAIDAGLVDVLVLWETSRGSRTLSDWVALLDACRDQSVLIHIISHDRTYNPRKSHDRKTLANDGVDAEHEVGRLSERVTRGVASAAVAGGFHGRTPFGYIRVIVGEKRTARGDLKPVREQRPDPDTAPVVTEVTTRVAANEPIRRIMRDLNARGIAAPNAPRWSAEGVKHLVRNHAYLGQRSHRPVNGDPTTVHPGTWDPIVAASIWECANAVLDTPGRGAAKPGGLKYLLSVIMHSPCGGVMGTKKEGDRLRYTCTADGCTSITMLEADEWVTEVVLARFAHPNFRRVFVVDDAATRAAARELSMLESELKAAQDSFATPGGISAAAMAAKELAMAGPIAAAAARARPKGVSLALMTMLDAVKMGRRHVRPAWKALPLPAQRELIRTVCESIVVGPATGRLTRWSTPAERRDAARARITITPRGVK